MMLRRLSPRGELFLIIGICFGYLIVSSLLVLLSGQRHFELTAGRALVGIAFELLALGLVFFSLRARGRRFGDFSLQFSWKAAAAGIPLFVFYLLIYLITATFVLLVWPGARDALTFRFDTSAPMGLILLFIVINSFFEETMVTAYAITALSRNGAAMAITASTLLRFAYHLYQGPLASISILPLGLLFGTMFWRWRNVWPLIVAHTIANVVSFAVMPQR
jgi:membrane protease YdiL (CAAX protease family)